MKNGDGLWQSDGKRNEKEDMGARTKQKWNI